MVRDPSRSRALAAAGIACALIALAAFLWVLHRPRAVAPLDRLSGGTGSSPRPGLLAPAGHEVADHRSSPRIRIVSSEGLPLEHALLASADGAWRRASLDEGLLDRERVAAATRICAPGHRARDATDEDGVIVLEPEALLVLHAPGIRDRLSEPPEPVTKRSSDACTFGFLDADRLAFAVARHLIPADEGTTALHWVLFWSADMRSELELDPGIAGRLEHVTRCPVDPVRAAVRVRVDRAGLADGERLRLEVSSRSVWERRRQESSVETFPGGMLSHYLDVVRMKAVLEGDSDSVSFPGVPLDADLIAVVREPHSRAFAFASFVHDETVHELSLQPACRLRATLRVADGSPLPDRVHVAWKQLAPEDASRACATNEWTDVDADGRLTIRGPAVIDPTAGGSPASLPVAEVTIRAPGFADVHARVDPPDPCDVDAGTLELSPDEPDFFVEPSFESAGIRCQPGDSVVWRNEAGSCSELTVTRAWTVDGRSAVACDRTRLVDESALRRLASPPQILMSNTRSAMRGLTRIAENVYRPEPMQEGTLTVVTTERAGALELRFSWRGLSRSTTYTHTRIGEPLTLTFNAPMTGVELSWRCGGDDPWKSMSIRGPDPRLELEGCHAEEPR